MPSHPEQQYLDLLRQIMESGCDRGDRTGTGTRAVFGASMRFDLTQGFPLFTTKRVYWKTAFKEMLWMLRGETGIRSLLRENVHIWTDWPLKKYRDATGDRISQEEFERRILVEDLFSSKWSDLGPVYGKQWRRWETKEGREIDQVAEVINTLKNNPTSRRIMWDGWNVGELDSMALPPCHKQYQFMVDTNTNELTVAMVQRSVDAFIGLAFNMSNLALVAHLVAAYTGLKPRAIVWFGMDTHIYSNHFDQVTEQLSRTPRPLPTFRLNTIRENIWDTRIEDLSIEGYDPHPPIKAPVAV